MKKGYIVSAIQYPDGNTATHMYLAYEWCWLKTVWSAREAYIFPTKAGAREAIRNTGKRGVFSIVPAAQA